MNRVGCFLGFLLAAIITGCVHPNVTTDRLTTFDVKTSPERVERGPYLTNHVAACMDCHSRRDWSRLAGPILLGTLGAIYDYLRTVKPVKNRVTVFTTRR